MGNVVSVRFFFARLLSLRAGLCVKWRAKLELVGGRARGRRRRRRVERHLYIALPMALGVFVPCVFLLSLTLGSYFFSPLLCVLCVCLSWLARALVDKGWPARRGEESFIGWEDVFSTLVRRIDAVNMDLSSDCYCEVWLSGYLFPLALRTLTVRSTLDFPLTGRLGCA
ncbi:hypothetical protein EJ06DRAFT_244730 [Trichodelitschia bisporula]|uniref:Uncharacterized protein n=1 Tax=Trichodelitschia bisporula TaxID=703511 RepID=A0A6G1HJG5_9PEZI|nr:hypothetical protein EJ06DRAFT_244730 [Trichodelitschia bisporula]